MSVRIFMSFTVYLCDWVWYLDLCQRTASCGTYLTILWSKIREFLQTAQHRLGRWPVSRPFWNTYGPCHWEQGSQHWVVSESSNKLPHDKTNKIRPVWSQSPRCTQWVAKDPSFLHADTEDSSNWVDAQADLSLCWAHRSFCWFCHEAAQMCMWSYSIGLAMGLFVRSFL